MEETNKQLKSVWGKGWEAIRKWFYPAWLIYETVYRFYDYAVATHGYVGSHSESITAYLGETGTQIVAIICSIIIFAICTAFLTVPASFILYAFFKEENLTGTTWERQLKRWC